jgi:hypothetical protein
VAAGAGSVAGAAVVAAGAGAAASSVVAGLLEQAAKASAQAVANSALWVFMAPTPLETCGRTSWDYSPGCNAPL